MKKNLFNLISAAAIATALSTANAFCNSSAQAATFDFGFQNIPLGNNNNGDAIVGQFSFSVTDTDSTSGKTLWQFKNAGPVNSFVSGIYFDWKGLDYSPITQIFTINALGTSSGVDYETGAGRLPQAQEVRILGNSLGFDNSQGNQAADLVLQPKSPGSDKDGIDQNETLAVVFKSVDATSLKSLILADTLRIGVRVQGIATNGGSDAFLDGALIPTPPAKPVPVPGFVLGILAAGALGGKRLLSKKQVA